MNCFIGTRLLAPVGVEKLLAAIDLLGGNRQQKPGLLAVAAVAVEIWRCDGEGNFVTYPRLDISTVIEACTGEETFFDLLKFRVRSTSFFGRRKNLSQCFEAIGIYQH